MTQDTTPSSADSVSILREAAAKARIGLRDWEIPQRRYDAIEAIDAALDATERAAIQPAGQSIADDADTLLRSLWDDSGLVKLMRPDQVRRIGQYIDARSPVSGQAGEDAQ